MNKRHRLLILAITLTAAAAMLFIAGRQAMSAKETFMVPMTDGTRLATDVFLPDNGTKLPVILMRTPYNKNGNDKFGVVALAMGFIIVVQDTRGRFASEGTDIPFDADGWWGPADGKDTVDWIASQPWCNGKIATFGGSALSIAQYMLAGTGTDKITFYHYTVGCPGLYLDGLTHGGVLRKALIYDWVTDNKYSDETLKIWMKHPLYDDYWKQRDLRLRWNQVKAPGVHIGGWYDIFAQGTIDAFKGIQEHGALGAKGQQKLVMGPWTHAVGSSEAGELKFPNATEPPNKINDLGKWAMQYLKGTAGGIQSEKPVAYYVMGDTKDPKAPGNEWRYAESWPIKSTATAYYLTGSCQLTSTKPTASAELKYVSDPDNTIPTIGGPQLTVPAGPRDQSSIENRKDLLVFTSQPLKAPLEITGKVNMRLWATTDAPDTDFIARLCVVYPDGTSYNICEGAQRAQLRESLSEVKNITPGKPYLYNIDMWSTSIVVNKGLRLRVHVASSSFPAFQVNKQDGSAFGSGKTARKANNAVLAGGKYTSCIVLPIVKAQK